MATLHLLGTGAAVSDPHRTTTMLAVENSHSLVVIDCGGDALQRVMAVGADPSKLGALILTHEHPDHISGFPLFMEKIWLLGRRQPLAVYGIAQALEQAQRLHDSFDRSDWTGYPGVTWHKVEHSVGATVFDSDSWRVRAAPGDHTVPVIGLRITDKTTDKKGGTVAYSCDTAFSERIVQLADSADILIHEATGAFPGHSSAAEAARAAQLSGAQRLLLVHLPPETELTEADMAEIRTRFARTEKGLEGGSYSF